MVVCHLLVRNGFGHRLMLLDISEVEAGVFDFVAYLFMLVSFICH